MSGRDYIQGGFDAIADYMQPEEKRIPMLWSGYKWDINAAYGAPFYQLTEAATTWNAFTLFHFDATNPHSTHFGKLMVRSKLVDSCRDGAVADNMWNAVSEQFVRSFRQKKLYIALNIPVQFFPGTIMFKHELPRVAAYSEATLLVSREFADCSSYDELFRKSGFEFTWTCKSCVDASMTRCA